MAEQRKSPPTTTHTPSAPPSAEEREHQRKAREAQREARTLNPPDVPLEEKQRQLEGSQPRDAQEAFITQDETDTQVMLTETDHYAGELEAGIPDDMVAGRAENQELLTERELRPEETDDAFKAAEEGMTYVPPVDPPTTRSDSYDDARVASGMGSSALDEPYNLQHHRTFLPGNDELIARVYEALHAESTTATIAERIEVRSEGATIILEGEVEDLEDSNNVIAVAQRVEDVEEVVDYLRVRAVEQAAGR